MSHSLRTFRPISPLSFVRTLRVRRAHPYSAIKDSERPQPIVEKQFPTPYDPKNYIPQHPDRSVTNVTRYGDNLLKEPLVKRSNLSDRYDPRNPSRRNQPQSYEEDYDPASGSGINVSRPHSHDRNNYKRSKRHSPQVPKEDNRKTKRKERRKLEFTELEKAWAHAGPGLKKFQYRWWNPEEPTNEELRRANKFFCNFPATTKPEWTKGKFREMEIGDMPEVAFLGRSNVGKSSLINALLNQKGVAFTSSKAGRTRAMSAFNVSNGELLLVDMPGYGHGSREEWGSEIMKYLTKRRELRRVFLLIDAEHGLKRSDEMMLELFAANEISFQIVLTKADKINQNENGGTRQIMYDLRQKLDAGLGGKGAFGEILCVAADPSKKGVLKVGISELRWSIMKAAGLDDWYN